MPRIVDVDKLKKLQLSELREIAMLIQDDMAGDQYKDGHHNFWAIRVIQELFRKHLEKYAVIVKNSEMQEEQPKQRSISPELEAALADLFAVNKGNLARRIKDALDNCK